MSLGQNNIKNVKSLEKKKIKYETLPVLPFKEIKDFVVIKKNSAFVMLGTVTPINADLMKETDLDEIYEVLINAFSTLNIRWAIYRYSTAIDVEKNIINCNEMIKTADYEDDIKILKEQLKTFDSYKNKGNNVPKFVLSFEVKARNYSSAVTILEEITNTVSNELINGDIIFSLLNDDEIKKLIYTTLNPKSSIIEEYNNNYELMDLIPGNIIDFQNGRYHFIDDKYCRYITLRNYPKNTNFYLWLDKLLNIKDIIDIVNITIINNPKNKEETVAKLDKSYGKAKRNIIDSKKQSDEISNIRKADSIENMIDNITSDDIQYYDTCIMIQIFGDTETDCYNNYKIVKRKIANCSCRATDILRKELNPLYSMLPIVHNCDILNNNTWNFSSHDIASLIPFNSSVFKDDKGIIVADDYFSSDLVISDYFSPINNNPHLFVVADTGAGKTYLLKLDALRHIPYVDHTIIFDLKGDIVFPFGQRINIDYSGRYKLNPFHIRNMVSDDDIYTDNVQSSFLFNKVDELKTFFGWLIDDLSKFDKSLMDTDFIELYKKFGYVEDSTELPKIFPTLLDYYNMLGEKIKDDNSESSKRRKNIMDCIRPYSHGSSSKLFNGQTNWEFNKFCVLGLNNVNDEIRTAVYDCLLKDVWQFCKKDGTIDPTLKNVYVDECHLFADVDNPQTLKFMVTNSAKQGRGFGMRLVAFTQNFEDLFSVKKFGVQLFNNCFHKIFLRLGETDLKIANSLYPFSDKENKLLYGQSARNQSIKGRGIFCRGGYRTAIQIRATDYEVGIIDPSQFKKKYNKDPECWTEWKRECEDNKNI